MTSPLTCPKCSYNIDKHLDEGKEVDTCMVNHGHNRSVCYYCPECNYEIKREKPVTSPLAINHEKRSKSRHVLHICTIYPDKPSPEMVYNTIHLNSSDRLTIKPIFIKAGTFSHRHRKDQPDPIQIQIRQQYLDMVPVDEWLLVLDSDELLLAPPDNVADMLDYLDANNMEVGMIIEFRSDGDIKGRPRLIRKKEGLKYGGPNQKHDYIDYQGRNYIDVNNEDTAMTLPLYFYHVKTAGQFMIDHRKPVHHPKWVEPSPEMKEALSNKLTGEVEQ